jgi:hypothetical protein
MEKSSKRGKIPQSDWPLIMGRYEAGETLASIARTYDCSPPAISYVVSRSRARQPEPETAAKPPGLEPQLIKASAPDGGAAVKPPTPTLPATPPAANGHDRPEAAIASPGHSRESNGFGTGERRVHSGSDELRLGTASTDRPQAEPAGNDGNGASHPAAAANGDHRRTLHLSLGSPPQRNGGGEPADTHQQPERPVLAQPTPPPTPSAPVTAHNGQDGAALTGVAGIRLPVYPEHNRRNDAENGPRKDAATFIDHELRARVGGDIAAFLAAFDVALGDDTQENRSALREATDRLLRAGARTRIELERLEARMPLPPRDPGRSAEASRQR